MFSQAARAATDAQTIQPAPGPGDRAGSGEILSAQAPVRLELAGGEVTTVRPVRPGDRWLYAAAVAALSPRARYLRFFAPNPIMRERDLDRLLEVRDGHQAVWVAVDATGTAGLGASRWAAAPGGGAEVALAVLDRVQGQGLGGLLLDRAILGARQAAFAVITAETFADNHAAMGLLRSRGLAPVALARGVASWQMALDDG